MKKYTYTFIAICTSFLLGLFVQQYFNKEDIHKELMSRAVADNDVLTYNNKIGDRFGIPRDVDFYFIVKTKEKAEFFSSFLQDYAYGNSSIEKRDDKTFGITLVIKMPIYQNVLLSVSGFMAILAKSYKIEYVGWGSSIQKGSAIGMSK